ncbi:MAG: CHC2 zinc finger domain-containing protein [Terricaulis sp.]
MFPGQRSPQPRQHAANQAVANRGKEGALALQRPHALFRYLPPAGPRPRVDCRLRGERSSPGISAKSRPAAGDFWACCPFHQENSPSFHVLDSKGIYKCFGCGEKGDAFTLAMKLEGLNFPEAVARIAELAGVPLPADETEDRGENERRKRLYAAAARTAKLYTEALNSPAGSNARAYLNGARHRPPISGPASASATPPGGWTWTLDKLRAEGFSFDEIFDAGLAREGDDGKRPIDTFRDRVTFEITDAGGKVIAFGGRALEKDAKAKYINSPECALYSKGRVLYRLKAAREVLAKSKAAGLVVAEGYLDVMAFERAGIGAVAPCGTALTDDQLQLVWRAGGEPVLCFDGDFRGPPRRRPRARSCAPASRARPHHPYRRAAQRRRPGRCLSPRRPRSADRADRRRTARVRRALRAREEPPAAHHPRSARRVQSQSPRRGPKDRRSRNAEALFQRSPLPRRRGHAPAPARALRPRRPARPIPTRRAPARRRHG